MSFLLCAGRPAVVALAAVTLVLRPGAAGARPSVAEELERFEDPGSLSRKARTLLARPDDRLRPAAYLITGSQYRATFTARRWSCTPRTPGSKWSLWVARSYRYPVLGMVRCVPARVVTTTESTSS